MGLGAIGGGFGLAVNGFNQGVREAKADQMQDKRDAYGTEVLAANTELLPQQTDLSKQKMRSASADLADREKIRSTEFENHKAKLDAETAAVMRDIAVKSMKGELDIQGARDQMLAGFGTKVEAGDAQGAVNMLNAMGQTPAFPRMKEFGIATNIEVAEAPEGSTDIAGQPIAGKAAKVTFANGQTQFLNPAMWLRQTKQAMAAAEMAGAKVLKPGEKWVTGSGKEIAEGNDKVQSGLIQDPETGEWYRPVGAAGGGRGAGAKAGAKSDLSVAVDNVLKNLAEKDPVAAAKIPLYAERAHAAGLSAQEAAFVAADAAQNPAKVRPQLNLRTGTFDSAYSDPQIAGGKKIPLGSSTGSIDELIKTIDPRDLQGQVQDMVGRYGDAAPQFVAAAFNDTERARILEQAKASGNQELYQTTERKFDLVRRTMKPPAGAKPAGKGGGVADRFKVGGLTNTSYTPPAGSPAARAAESRSKAAGESNAKAVRESESKAALSTQFQADLKTMSPEDLVRKYDSQRGSMLTSDLQALKAAEQKL